MKLGSRAIDTGEYSLGVNGLAQVIDNKPYLAVEEAKFKMASDIMEQRSKENKQAFELAAVNPIINAYDRAKTSQTANKLAQDHATWLGANPYARYTPEGAAKIAQFELEMKNHPDIIRGTLVDKEVTKRDEWLKKNGSDKDMWEFNEDVANDRIAFENYQKSGSITGNPNDANDSNNWYKFQPPIGTFDITPDLLRAAKAVSSTETTIDINGLKTETTKLDEDKLQAMSKAYANGNDVFSKKLQSEYSILTPEEKKSMGVSDIESYT